MWVDAHTWVDLFDWGDGGDYAPVVAAEMSYVRNVAPAPDLMTAIKDIGRFDLRSAGALTGNVELVDIVPAGYLLDKVIIKETAGNTCSVKGGSSLANDDLWTAEAVSANGILNIGIGMMFSVTLPQSVFLTFTAGSGYSVDIYLTINKII